MLTAVTPGVSALLRNVVLPHAQIFAILIGLGDFAIGISLSLGLFTRLGGMLAILRAVTNILVAGGAGPDTVGFNAMLIAAGAIGLTTEVRPALRPRQITLGSVASGQTLAVSGLGGQGSRSARIRGMRSC